MSLADLPALLDRLAQGTVGPDDRETLEALAEARPAHVTAHAALAQVCEQEGRREQARRRWKRARLLAPGSPAVREGLRRTATPSEDAPPDDSSDLLPDETAPGSELREGEPRAGEAAPPTGEAPAEAFPAAEDDADLDNLIEELEDARIEASPDPDDVPAPDLEAGADDDVVSPTLARIYEAQGQLAEAARVHRRLAEQHPDEAEAHRRQAEALDARAAEEGEAGGDDPGAPNA